MTKFYVASVRDWPEARMLRTDLQYLTDTGSFNSYITSDYKTVRGLIKYRVTQWHNYYRHVWAIFEVVPGRKDRFLGLQYNHSDQALCDLARRYMKARKYKGDKTSGVSLELRVS